MGQGSWEEIDRATRTSSGAGRGTNWGWRVMEGRHCYQPSTGCSTSGKTLPLLEYDHGNGRCAVTGGYVYRGANIPALVGGYVFADFCAGRLQAITRTGGTFAVTDLRVSTSQIASFGVDGRGELYVLSLAGGLYRIDQS